MECNVKSVPKVGMTFESLDDLYGFLNQYGKQEKSVRRSGKTLNFHRRKRNQVHII